MSKKLGLILIILLVMVATTLAVPPVAKNQGHLPKADWLISNYTVANPSDILPEGSRNPNSLDAVVVSQDFDDLHNGELPSGWTQVSVDTGFCTQFNRNSTWEVLNYGASYSHSGTNVMICHFNDNALPNDDWLILPSQNLGGRITLRYYVASQDPNYLESYEVRVSTTGTQPADFTNLVAAYTNIPIVWTLRSHDLSAFAGNPFYVAIHYNSVDKFAIKLDDLELEAAVGSFSGHLEGIVTDAATLAPIEGATVRIPQFSLSARTDANGHYMLRNVAANLNPGYVVNTSHTLYATRIDSGVAIDTNETTQFNITLDRLNLEFHDFTSTAAPVHIADMDTAVMTMTLTDNYRIHDLDVVINVRHTYDSDLSVWLQSPHGRRAKLMSGEGGSEDNIINARFEDEAILPISNGVAPFTGTFIPEEPLTRFDGDSTVGGLWKLLVYDDFEDDTGHIESFTIHIASLVPGSPTSVQNGNSGLPTSFSFVGNYPNPFNATTQFSFSLAQPSRVELVLYNTLGQETARLLNQVMEAGAHSVSFNASAMTSGIYFARMSAGDFSATRRVILLK